jgi:flagellin-like protein
MSSWVGKRRMKHKKGHRSGDRFSSNKDGVSEIIASLLLIAITVILFSSVLYFVTNMPSPQDQTVSDFKAQTGISGSNFFINITHEGGQTLTNDSTGMYLIVNDVRTNLFITSSNPGIGNEWGIGSVWSYVIQYAPNMAISIMITNTQTNNIVWQSTLASSTAQTPPIIENRGLDPSPVYDGSSVVFYATINDPVGMSDVASVYVTGFNLTGVGDNPISLTDPDGDGTYTSAMYTASIQWNDQTVVFTAMNRGGMEATAPATLSVIQNGTAPSVAI